MTRFPAVVCVFRGWMQIQEVVDKSQGPSRGVRVSNWFWSGGGGTGASTGAPAAV